MIIPDEVPAEQFSDPDDFYYMNPRLQEYRERCEDAQKLRRPHIDSYAEFLASCREEYPSLGVIQPPKWWKRGNPAVFKTKDETRAEEKRCKQDARWMHLWLVDAGVCDEIDQDDFFKYYDENLAPRKR